MSEKSFTVRDRRHFAPDGQVREETEEATSPASSEPQTAPAPPVEDPPIPGGASEPGASASPVASPPDQGSGSPEGYQPGPADFSQFLLSLGVQASALLTGEGLPDNADPQAVLDGARSLISILEMLRDKTEGRRTAEEEKVLEGLLFELRMAYVEKTPAGGS